MNKKIPITISSIGIFFSVLSIIFTLILFANWGGPGQWKVGGDAVYFSAFVLFFLIYNVIAVVVFSNAEKDIKKYTFFGTLICVNLVLLYHTYSLLMTITVKGDWGFLWWSFLTMFGIPISLVVGGILGSIVTKIKNK